MGCNIVRRNQECSLPENYLISLCIGDPTLDNDSKPEEENEAGRGNRPL